MPTLSSFPMPDRISVVSDQGVTRRASVPSDQVTCAGVCIELRTRTDGALRVAGEFGSEGVTAIGLHWTEWPVEGLVFSDAWERTYGEAGWAPVDASRPHPWYWAVTDPRSDRSEGVGVRVGPGAFCSWDVDGSSVTLWLDVRNGGAALVAPERRIELAELVRVEDQGSSYATVAALCAAMNPAGPRRAVGALIGNNDWYYTYGEGRDQTTVLRDAEILSDLAGGLATRPFAVVDCGWSPGSYVPGGPYSAGEPGRFDDMPGLARDIISSGARPGIWIRPTATIDPSSPLLLRGPGSTREDAQDLAIDLTKPGALDQVGRDVATVVGWGYELVKFDFSTFDLLGRFHPGPGRELTEPGWALHDRSMTNAEVLRSLYSRIRADGGDAVLLGCNTVGHLAAGFIDVSRTGDDTSGKDWAITRKMGVNTLAFRLPQHGVFFALDADCVPATSPTPWASNRQFLDAVARTGTGLFVSLDPAELTPSVRADLSAAMELSEAVQNGRAEAVHPIDWELSRTPTTWASSDEVVEYDWSSEPAFA